MKVERRTICCLVLLAATCGAEAAEPKSSGKPSFHIEINDSHGSKLADSGRPAAKASSAVFAFEREYQPGDTIVVHGPSPMVVRVDDWIPECVVYLSKAASFSFEVPYGPGEGATRSPFLPDSFAGSWHRVTARELTAQERSGYRNLAMNACDAEVQPPPVEGTPAAKQPLIFPHASTNSVSRLLPDFRARNAIDGMTLNGHHGVWPYQSWGPELRTDLWWKVDFGRVVEVDKIRLMVRSDFPHDSYWKTAVLEFSDGDPVPVQIKESGEFQEFTFPKRKISWVRLNQLVPTDPARWCALMEAEVWGRDVPSQPSR